MSSQNVTEGIELENRYSGEQNQDSAMQNQHSNVPNQHPEDHNRHPETQNLIPNPVVEVNLNEDSSKAEQMEYDPKRTEYFQYSCKCSKFCHFKKFCDCFTCCIDKSTIIDFLKFNKDNKFTDKSSIISSVMRKREDEKFWDDRNLAKVMGTYNEDNDENLKDFFSILIYDWHEHEEKSKENYFLVRKFRAFENASRNQIEKSVSPNEFKGVKCEIIDETLGSNNTQSEDREQTIASISQQQDTSNNLQRQEGTPSLNLPTAPKITEGYTIFEKLFKVLNDKELRHYHETCLKVIYHYADESSKNFDEENKILSLDISNALTKALEIQHNDKYKVKILKVLIIFLENDEKFSEMKSSINKFLMEPPASYDGKAYYDLMLDHCDRLFFNLVFYLTEDLIPMFKAGYIDFIKTYKDYFGEYWTFAIKENGRLLYLLTKLHEFDECGMFILNKTEDSMLKTSITSLFTDVAEFQAVFNEPLDEHDKSMHTELKKFVDVNLFRWNKDEKLIAKSLAFEKLFSNTPRIRRLLFGREDFNTKSIFEDILSHKELGNHAKYFDNLINYIWNKFKLWDTPQILTLRNPLGKRYIDYVFESCAVNQKIKFLKVKHESMYTGTQKPMGCMMLRASLIPTKSNTIDKQHLENENNFKVKNYIGLFVDFQLDLIDNTVKNEEYEYEADNLRNMLYLLEEMYQFCSCNTENFEVIKKVMDFTPTIPENNYFLIPKKNFLLGLMMIHLRFYATKDGLRGLLTDKDQISRLTLDSTLDPFLYLVSLIVTQKYDDFVNQFPENFQQIVTEYKDKFRNNEKNFEHISTNYCFVFLYGAIKANQKDIVQLMFDYNSFDINYHEFPTNMKAGEIHDLILKIYLKYKFQLGRDVDIPEDWITHKVVKEFLDSRITNQGNFYKFDCKFLLTLESQDEKPDNHDDDFMFNEDYETVKYMLKNYKLKSLVSHPVMETVVRTKIEKYNRIFFWNLVLFTLFYIVPTIRIAYILHSGEDIAEINSSGSRAVAFYSAITLAFLYGREFLQLVAVFEWRKYFQKYSNYIEISMILLCISTTVIFCKIQVKSYHLLTSLEAVNIALTVFSTLNLYLVLKFSVYIKCFFMAFRTYISILFYLLPLSIGAILLIFILFNKPNEGKIEDFHNLNNTIVKYFMMYNGDLGISASDIVGPIQVITIAIVIMFTITKSNLILAIVLDDVQKILRQAKEITLKKNAQKYVDFAEKIEKLYKSYIKSLHHSTVLDANPNPTHLDASAAISGRISASQEPPKMTPPIATNAQNHPQHFSGDSLLKRLCFCLQRLIINMQIAVLKLMIGKYPNIHSLDIFYVDKITKCVYMKDQRPLFGALLLSFKCWRSGGKLIQQIRNILDAMLSSNLRLDSSTMEEIKEILEKRNETDSENEKDEEIVKLKDEIARMSRSIENMTNVLQNNAQLENALS